MPNWHLKGGARWPSLCPRQDCERGWKPTEQRGLWEIDVKCGGSGRDVNGFIVLLEQPTAKLLLRHDPDGTTSLRNLFWIVDAEHALRPLNAERLLYFDGVPSGLGDAPPSKSAALCLDRESPARSTNDVIDIAATRFLPVVSHQPTEIAERLEFSSDCLFCPSANQPISCDVDTRLELAHEQQCYRSERHDGNVPLNVMLPMR